MDTELFVESMDVLAPETLDFYEQSIEFFQQFLILNLSTFYLLCFLTGLLIVLIFAISFK